MRNREVFKRIKEAIDEIPVIDLHCHIRVDKPNAVNLAELIFYHFISWELMSSGQDITKELPDFAHPLPGNGKAVKAALEKYIPQLENIKNTTTYWGLNRIFEDLYGFDFQRIDSRSWKSLYEKVLRTSDDDKWTEEVFLRKCKAEVIVPTLGDLDEFEKTDKRWVDKGIFSPSFEGDIVSHIRNYLMGGNSLREALRNFFQRCKSLRITSLTGVKSSPFRFLKAGEGRGEKLRDKILKGDSLSSEDNNVLVNIILEVANEIDWPWVMAFSIWPPTEQKAPGQTLLWVDHHEIPEICRALNEFRNVRIFVYLPSYVQSQELCTATRMFPNIYPLGFQWHGFFFPYIERMIEERLNVLPMNRPVGFMSDAYSTEWLYGKLSIVRHAFAKVLSEKVEEGLYTEKLAVDIARKWLYDNPREAFFRK